ncbi:hypothetical protein TcCL_Unassigned04599 [Trypanosoma cruzi]|nr:hypothetical protein TcCL_Unassigned04599 [Trypanosoma cruzi]
MLMLPNTLKAVHGGSKAHLLSNVQGVLHRIQGKNAGATKAWRLHRGIKRKRMVAKKNSAVLWRPDACTCPRGTTVSNKHDTGPTASSPPHRAPTRKTPR